MPLFNEWTDEQNKLYGLEAKQQRNALYGRIQNTSVGTFPVSYSAKQDKDSSRRETETMLNFLRLERGLAQSFSYLCANRKASGFKQDQFLQ